jgi:transcriptional regulator GlxA family with amidase domain
MLEYLVARALIEDRMREVSQQHQAREARRGEQPPTTAPAVRKPPRHPRLWSLVHLRHTYS